MHWRWWLLAALLASAFGSLGVWQLGRAQQKRAMLQAAQATLAERQPVDLALAGDPALINKLQWSAGRGRFLPGPSVLLDSQIRAGKGVGVRVYRLFQPESGGVPLLVDLGWLPLAGDRSHMRGLPPPELDEVRGLLSAPASSGLMQPTAVAQSDGDVLVTGITAPALPALLGQSALAARVLRLDPAIPVGGERDLDVLPNTMPPERHIAYAVQWFALAASVLIIALLLTRRRRNRHDITA